MDLTPEDWTNIIDVNVKGVYYTTRAVLPEMVERQTGTSLPLLLLQDKKVPQQRVPILHQKQLLLV